MKEIRGTQFRYQSINCADLRGKELVLESRKAPGQLSSSNISAKVILSVPASLGYLDRIVAERAALVLLHLGIHDALVLSFANSHPIPFHATFCHHTLFRYILFVELAGAGPLS
jgi:hypothetical protein